MASISNLFTNPHPGNAAPGDDVNNAVVMRPCQSDVESSLCEKPEHTLKESAVRAKKQGLLPLVKTP